MRIKYHVFWVEDDNSWFDTTQEIFKDTLEEWGFVLVCERAKNLEEVKAAISSTGLKDYDLLLIDYTLKSTSSQQNNGDDVIKFIRSNDIYTDVLFYSSAVDNIHDSMLKNELEGVYTSDRNNIEYKFEKVVKTTIKKVQEVNAIRGLLMAETSDLDEIMLKIIKQALSSDTSGNIEKYIVEKIGETITDNIKRADSEDTTTLQKINDGRIFTSFHKAKLIQKICKLNQIDIKKFFENYNKDVLRTRNIFAHVKEGMKDGKKVLISTKTGEDETFNEERCVEIRKTLIKYREILENISTKL